MPHHATVWMSEQHRLAIQQCSMTVWDCLEKQWSSLYRLIYQGGIYELARQLNTEKRRGGMRRREKIERNEEKRRMKNKKLARKSEMDRIKGEWRDTLTPAVGSSLEASISWRARTERHWARTNTHTERSGGTFWSIYRKIKGSEVNTNIIMTCRLWLSA